MTAEPASFKGDLVPIDRSRENGSDRGCKASAEGTHRGEGGRSSKAGDRDDAMPSFGHGAGRTSAWLT
jgi:hypothetical protein